jgi:hypothetical protein
MKYFMLLFAVAALAFASDDGCNDTNVGALSPGSDAISLTLEHDWTQAHQLLGLDAIEDHILATYNNDGKMQFYSRTTGAPSTSMYLSASNTGCFGVAWNNSLTTPVYYTDDWFGQNLYHTEDSGTTWGTVAAPNGNKARGMDFDGTDYWCTNGNGGGLWKFQPGGAKLAVAIPQVPTQPSGLAVFPFGSNIGVVVAAYTTHNFYFYSWDGSSMTYLGSAPCPVTGIVGSYGLTYSDASHHLYWSYKDTSGSYHLTEISFAITSLSRSSWGSIKTSF